MTSEHSHPGSAVVAPPTASTVARLLAASAVLGVVVALGFEAFATASHEVQHLVWRDIDGALATIAVATVGGLVLGVALRFVPGGAGPHPADGHGLIPEVEGNLTTIASIVVVGFVSLVAGASLGPEGAVLPAAVAVSVFAARTARIGDPLSRILPAVGVSALLAAMFGHPVAGAIPLVEMLAVASTAAPVMLVVLPALTAAATAVLTLQVIEAEPAGHLPLGTVPFEVGHLVWAVAIGVLAGGTGLWVAALVPRLRRVTRRLDSRSVVLTATLGGLALGVLYALGGDEVRFAGIPEILVLVADEPGVGAVLVAVVVKVLATALCLAVGYRGGTIFPVAFVGAATGLALHVVVGDAVLGGVPLPLALGCGLAAAIATGVGMPVTAALIAATVLGVDLLPLAILSIVVAHAVHLLAGPRATGAPAH